MQAFMYLRHLCSLIDVCHLTLWIDEAGYQMHSNENVHYVL